LSVLTRYFASNSVGFRFQGALAFVICAMVVSI
jgi:hypothetical protein